MDGRIAFMHYIVQFRGGERTPEGFAASKVSAARGRIFSGYPYRRAITGHFGLEIANEINATEI